jgi:photosystem II stability/assembly factor-like uncharacterized protein
VSRFGRRGAVVTLELILAVPVLLIVLLAVLEVGLILAASKHVEFASRQGAKLAAEISRTGGPPDLGTFNLPTTPDNLKDRVDEYLVTAGYTNSCTVILEHNAAGVPNPVQVDNDGTPCPCSPDPIGPLPSSVPGPPLTTFESVRVTVCLSMTDNLPNSLATFGLDYGDDTIRHSTTFRYENAAATFKQVWAVGGSGTIRNSADEGTTWQGQTSSTSITLRAVDFVDTQNGWAVGDGGLILRTTNGGATWTAVSSLGGFIGDIDFVDPNRGWAVGSVGGSRIFVTSNGGLTWSVQPLVTSPTFGLNSIDMLDGSNGWVAGGFTTVARTTNGGATWTPIPTPASTSFLDIDFADPLRGVVASAEILATTNGGATWNVYASPQIIDAVDLVDASRGWAVGRFGTILSTTDGGLSWTPQTSGTTQHLIGVDFVDASRGWAVGTGGVILHTSNGGATWTLQASGTTQFLTGVKAAPQSDE